MFVRPIRCWSTNDLSGEERSRRAYRATPPLIPSVCRDSDSTRHACLDTPATLRTRRQYSRVTPGTCSKSLPNTPIEASVGSVI
jgi:hypothetical protein